MYNNTGKCIKSLTKVIVIVEMGFSVVGGLVLAGISGVVIGLLVGALGCLLAWLSGLILATYGDIADNLYAIRVKIAGEEEVKTVEIAGQVMTEEELLAEGAWECVSCGRQNPIKSQLCIKCGTSKAWSEEKSKK